MDITRRGIWQAFIFFFSSFTEYLISGRKCSVVISVFPKTLNANFFVPADWQNSLLPRAKSIKSHVDFIRQTTLF